MFRFLFRRPYPRRVRPGPVLATITVSFGALALQSSHEPTQPDPLQPPLRSLLRAYFVFSLCSFPSLVDASPRILSFFSAIPVLRQVSEAFLRVTFFDQFVGAETVDGCIPLLHNLRRSNQGALFNYSVELPHGSPNDPSQRALESTLHSIDIAGDFEHSLSSSSPATTGTWVAVKLSTLLPDPSALCVLSDWIVRQHIHPETPNHSQIQIPFPGAPAAHDLQLFLQSSHHDDPNITQHHIQSLRALHTHLRKICTLARDRGIRLTIDAEETWFQPAIDLYSVLLMQEFNSLKARSTSDTGKSSKGGSRAPQPLVYTTLQAYLVRAPTFLNFLIKHANDNQYSLGIKLVRGAYIEAEVDAHAAAHNDRSSSSDDDDTTPLKSILLLSSTDKNNPPTYPNKQSTDAAYDDCVRVLVREIARDVTAAAAAAGEKKVEGKPAIAVLFGTHNWKSSRLVLDEILKAGLGKKEEVVVVEESGSGIETKEEKKTKKIVLSDQVRQRVCMAQLYGMSDSLAAFLVDTTSHHPDASTRNIEYPPSPPFVIRYVPYGPLRDVMPYLARRAVENRSVLGATSSTSDGSDSGDGRNSTSLFLMGKDLGGETEPGGGGAVGERKRLGRMIRERLVGFWRF